MYRAIGAALALALMAYPAHAGKSQRELFTPQTEKQRKLTCAVGLLFIPHPACFYRVGEAKAAKGKAQVTIHRGPLYTCPNGNTYKIMRVSNPRSVCKNSFKHGSSVPACTNISGRNGSAHSIITVDKRGTHLAHEIRHACDTEYVH